MVPSTNKHSVYRGSKMGLANPGSQQPTIPLTLTYHPDPPMFQSILLIYDKTCVVRLRCDLQFIIWMDSIEKLTSLQLWSHCKLICRKRSEIQTFSEIFRVH